MRGEEKGGKERGERGRKREGGGRGEGREGGGAGQWNEETFSVQGDIVSHTHTLVTLTHTDTRGPRMLFVPFSNIPW